MLRSKFPAIRIITKTKIINNSAIHTAFILFFKFLTIACSATRIPRTNSAANNAIPPPKEFPPPLLINSPLMAVRPEIIMATISKTAIGVMTIFLIFLKYGAPDLAASGKVVAKPR